MKEKHKDPYIEQLRESAKTEGERWEQWRKDHPTPPDEAYRVSEFGKDWVEEYAKYIPIKRKSGKLAVWGLCPFCKEDNPACLMIGRNGMFACLNCGKGGDFPRFLIFWHGREHDINTPAGKLAITDQLIGWLLTIPNETIRAHVLNSCSSVLGISKLVLLEQLRRAKQ